MWRVYLIFSHLYPFNALFPLKYCIFWRKIQSLLYSIFNLRTHKIGVRYVVTPARYMNVKAHVSPGHRNGLRGGNDYILISTTTKG